MSIGISRFYGARFARRGLMLLFFLSVAGIVRADGSSQKMGLEDFSRVLIGNHPFFKAESLSKAIEEARSEGISRNQNWALDVRPRYRYEEPVSSSLFAAEEQTRLGATAELNRPFWSTGGALRMGYSGSSVEQTVNPIVFSGGTEGGFQSVLPDFLSHRAFVGFSQPLFKNRGGIQDRLPLDLQGYRLQMSTLQSLEAAEDFLLERAYEFLDWALLFKMSEIAVNRETLAASQWEETLKERDANYVDEVDLIRAENNYIQAQQRSIDLKSRAQAMADTLSVVLGDASVKDAIPKVPQFNIDFKVASSLQSQSFRVLEISELVTLSLERELEFHSNASLIDLSLEVMGGLASGGENFDESTSFDQPLAEVGLVFRHPLGDHPQDAETERLQLEVAQSKLRRQHTQRNIAGAFQGLDERVNGLRKVIELNQKQLEISLKKTKAEELMYRQGRSSLNFVIQSRDEEAQIQSQLMENRVKFRKLQLEYDALRDVLFLRF